MTIPKIIANRFYDHFEKEIYEFTFTFKTQATLDNESTILKLCEEAVCAAHGVTYQEYVDDVADITYNEIFSQAAGMTEQVINIMLEQFAEQHNGN